MSLVLLLFSGCEKDITLSLPNPPDEIVVEGHIDTGFPQYPYVILTKNSPYYTTFTTADFDNYFVHNAVIKVFDGTDTVTLQETSFDTMGIKFYIYTNLNMVGTIGKTYSLSIDAEGKHLSAVTTIPQSYPLDSIWVQTDVVSTDTTLVQLFCKYTDPPSLGQYVRYFTRVKNKNKDSTVFYPGLNSVFSDQVINGKTIVFSLARGINRNDSTQYNNLDYFHRGDTITVKWSNIDKAQYNFWSTLEFELGNNGNPFVTPTTVQSNINGGLGIWGGYASSYKTVIAPK